MLLRSFSGMNILFQNHLVFSERIWLVFRYLNGSFPIIREILKAWLNFPNIHFFLPTVLSPLCTKPPWATGCLHYTLEWTAANDVDSFSKLQDIPSGTIDPLKSYQPKILKTLSNWITLVSRACLISHRVARERCLYRTSFIKVFLEYKIFVKVSFYRLWYSTILLQWWDSFPAISSQVYSVEWVCLTSFIVLSKPQLIQLSGCLSNILSLDNKLFLTLLTSYIHTRCSALTLTKKYSLIIASNHQESSTREDYKL